MKSFITTLFLLVYIVNNCYSQTNYSSINHFSLNIPTGWKPLTKMQIDTFSKKVGVQGIESFFVENPDTRIPGLCIGFVPQPVMATFTFKRFTEEIFINGFYNKVMDSLENKLSNFFTSSSLQPVIDAERELIIMKGVQEVIGVGSVINCAIMAGTKYGIISISFYMLEKDFEKYKEHLSNSISSFNIESEYRLSKN